MFVKDHLIYVIFITIKFDGLYKIFSLYSKILILVVGYLQNKTKNDKFRTLRHSKTLRTLRKMNTQFNANVYCFTEELFKDLLNNFDGKVVGEDGMKMEDVMKHFFGDFVPDKDNLVEPDSELAPPPKKVKKVKDPTKPKRDTTALLLWQPIRDEVRRQIQVEVGEQARFTLRCGMISRIQKMKAILKRQEDKARYAKEWKHGRKENA